MVLDDRHQVNPALAQLSHSAFAVVQADKIYFRRHLDTVGPLSTKAQGKSAINAVAPAIADAVANATGVRFSDLPLPPGPDPTTGSAPAHKQA